MANKVPPLEQTKASILNAKGAAWLKEQEAKFGKTYGNAIPDASLRMWLIAKQGGIQVEEIKAAAGSEGEAVTIAEMVSKSKNEPESHGWTKVANGGKFEQPDSQTKYSLAAAVLAVTEGETSTKKPRKDLVITDGSGITKLVAYADAASTLAELSVKPGSVLHFPILTVQYGHHNFDPKEPNKVWWKFALPPFEDAQPRAIERDAKEFFYSMESDVVKENMPACLTGFVTHIEERENEICSICTRWVTEKDPHDACQGQEGFEIKTEVKFTGTATSVTGQTSKLSFEIKPKLKVAVDLVEIFGRMNKVGAIDVAFVRKAGTTAVEVPVAAPKAAAAPKLVKKAPPPPAEPEEAEEAPEEAAEEEVEEVAPPPPPARKVPAKAAAVPQVAPNPNKAGSDARKAALAAYEASPELGDGMEEEPEEPTPAPAVKVVTKKAAPAKPAAAAVQVEIVDVPEPILKHVEKSCKNFGGKNRIFVLVRTAIQTGLLGEGDEEALGGTMQTYIASLVEQGRLEYTTPSKNEVKWTG